MIITCPACNARYKIRDEQLSGAAKTITCRKCSHKFVVYPEGSKPEDQASIPLSVQAPRTSSFPTDDEEDAPTTIMSHGSALAQQIREAVEDSEREAAAQKASAAAGPPAPAPQQAPASSPGFRRTLLWLGTIIVLLSALGAYFLG